MSRTILSFAVISLLAFTGLTQTGKNAYYTCAYGEGNYGLERCKTFQSDLSFSEGQAGSAVDTILKQMGLGDQRNFVLIPCVGINTAMAGIDDKGTRIIWYDNQYMAELNRSAKANWPSLSILAHEIGHHLNGHMLSVTNLEQSRKDELAADYFSGFVLYRLNASLEQAQAAVRALPDIVNEKNSRYPKTARRLEAIENGYNAAKSQGPLVMKPKPDTPGSSSVPDKARRSNMERVIIGSTGYIKGLEGRLNPILSSDRTYVYADNIAIEGGKNQPVQVTPNQPFLVEDSLGNQFELKVIPTNADSFTIEYQRLSSAADKQYANLNLKVVDENSQPIRGAEILAIFSDGTYLKGTTDSKGNARIQNLKQRIVTIYCAHQNYTAFYKEGYDVDSDLLIGLKADRGKGSIIIISTGYIPGLDGRLNPILDSTNRMYLYAENISIENGRKQPVSFTLNEPFQVEDSKGKRFELKVVAIIAASSLIEFTRLN